jgi:ABC-2 type transport system permease protein
VSLAIGLIGVITVGATFLVNKSLYDGFVGKFIGWFSILTRNQSFGLGIINISDIVYYLSFAVAFIFLTIRNIEKRRWS